MLPDAKLSHAQNAARLAVFAEAAYFKAADRTVFQEEYDGTCIWWDYDNAAGLVYHDAERIVISLAGTDDRADIRNGYDLLSQSFGDWSTAVDLAVVRNISNTCSTAGFLAYSALCHRGLQAAFADIGEDSRPIWVAGHSLGGAAAQILQCTQLYAAARVYTYGAPRVFRGYVPEALRVSVRRITDPVVYGPFGFNHPSSDTIWVRYPGSVRSQIPLRLKPLAAAYRTAVWSRGLIQTALASLGVPVRPTLADGHSMHRYRRDLYPLR